MLRIDIDHGTRPATTLSPATNPYVGRTGLDQIWSRGLRNPWRWSFDRLTARSGSRDVGQGRYEEVDRARVRTATPAGRGAELRLAALEGRACYKPSSGCSTSGKRCRSSSTAMPSSAPTTARCRRLRLPRVGLSGPGRRLPVRRLLLGPDLDRLGDRRGTPATAPSSATRRGGIQISSFGEDEAGELYVWDLAGGGSTGSPRPRSPERRRGACPQPVARKSRHAAATSSGSANSS